MRAGTSSIFGHGQQYRIRGVTFFHEHDLDVVTGAADDFPSDKIGCDRKFAQTAVDEHGQTYAPGSPKIEQCAKARAHRATGKKHIIHEDQIAALNIKGDIGAA